MPGAREKLVKRYFDQRYYHARRSAPGVYKNFDNWESNQSFFTVYFACEQSYRFGEARFRKYLETSLSHALYRKNTSDLPLSSIVYLDETINGEKSEMTFHDVVSSSSGDDPRIYLNYLEEVYLLEKAPKQIDGMVLAVARLKVEGHSLNECAALLHISPKQAKTRYAKYVAYIRKTLAKGDKGRVFPPSKKSDVSND
jgi:hypothetical protein